LGSLTQGTDGHLYGLAQRGGSKGSGTIFKYVLATNTLTVLRHLDYSVDGANPEGNLVEANDGKFYGMFPSNGRIFSIAKDGSFAIVHTSATTRRAALRRAASSKVRPLTLTCTA
jgi:uncharacterized repeat protein (TIGR03803 family)